jgi:hypothetical protein
MGMTAPGLCFAAILEMRATLDELLLIVRTGKWAGFKIDLFFILLILTKPVLRR